MHGPLNVKKRKLTVCQRMDLPPPSGGLQYNTVTIHWQNLQSSIKHSSYSLSLWGGTAVAQWLRCCATIRKVAGSIPDGVSGFFIDIKSF